MTRILALIGLTLALTTTAVVAKTAGTVNGMVITVEEANKALKVLTKGKDTWETIPEKGKTQLIQMMAPSKLVAEKSKKSLTAKEKEALIKGADEIDLVNSGLEETMISAYHDIRLIYKRSKSIKDLRTAGFVNAINKVADSYKSLGIFP